MLCRRTSFTFIYLWKHNIIYSKLLFKMEMITSISFSWKREINLITLLEEFLGQKYVRKLFLAATSYFKYRYICNSFIYVYMSSICFSNIVICNSCIYIYVRYLFSLASAFTFLSLSFLSTIEFSFMIVVCFFKTKQEFLNPLRIHMS